MLTKTQMVLEEDQEHSYHEDSAGNEFVGVEFYDRDSFNPPQDRSTGCHTKIAIAIDIWEDMGSPDKITLTIEPGDLLNKEDEND